MSWSLEGPRLRLGMLAVVAVTLGLGCELDTRLTELSGGERSAVGSLEPSSAIGADASSPGEGVDSNLPLAPGVAARTLGAACQQNTDCDAGNCVDGICCDSPCTDLCAACNLPGSAGTCSPAPSDPLCPDATCQGQNSECRPLGDAQAALNCEAVGVCRTSADCTPNLAPLGTPCQQGTGTCDGLGACLVPNKSALGVGCAADDECAEGHCVASGPDGARLCCDAACDGVCQTCSTAGRCEGTPATDPRCTAITCPADNVCRDYADAITDGLCRSFGQCRSLLDCTTPDFFTGLRPDAQCVCDPASGDCALAAGNACTGPNDCASGACVATPQGNLVCCSGSCAAGLSCNSSGTGCVQCEGTQIECDGNSQRSCNAGALVTTPCPNGCTPGAGCNALPPVGFPCNAGQCATGGICQQDTAGQARCCVRDCAAEGKVCSPSGSCDCPPGQVANGTSCLLEAGDPCQASTQCQAGLTCVDGVCCSDACDGFCERCQAGTGLCAAVAAGQQEVDAASGNNCSNGFVCTGARNDCRATTGQACTNANGSTCVSGACQPTVGGGARVCCSQTCPAGLSCRSNGQGCVQCESAAQCGNGCNVAQGICNPLSAPGATCSVASQCSTNGCVPASDGNFSRCCANCAPGQLCTAGGQCVNDQSELGGNCRSNADCRVGVCSGGICCNESCDPTCEVCNGAGTCESNGACDAFDCIVPNPPPLEATTLTSILTFASGTPPAASGGTVRDGRYTPVGVDVYGNVDLTANDFTGTSYEFRARSVQLAQAGFFQSNGAIVSFLPAQPFAGTFTTSGTSIQFDVTYCGTLSLPGAQVQPQQYTATANGFQTVEQVAEGTVVIRYSRQ